MFVLAAFLVRGRVGRALVAIRDNEIAAEHDGRRPRALQDAARSRSARRTRASAARCSRCRSASSPRSPSRSRCRSRSWRRSSSAAWPRSRARCSARCSSSSCRCTRPDVDEALAGRHLRRRADPLHVPAPAGAGLIGAACARSRQPRQDRGGLTMQRHGGGLHRLGGGAAGARAARERVRARSRTAAEAGGGGGGSDPGITDKEIKLGGSIRSAARRPRTGAIADGAKALLRLTSTPRAASTAARSVPDARRRLRAAEGRGERAPAGRAGAGVRALQHARHAEQPGDLGLHQPAEGAAGLRRHRRLELRLRRRRAPVHDGLAAQLRHRGQDLRGVPQEEEARRQGRRALPERRLRQGPARRLREGHRGLRHQGRRRRESTRSPTRRSPRRSASSRAPARTRS